VSGQLHALAALAPGKDPRYRLDRRYTKTRILSYCVVICTEHFVFLFLFHISNKFILEVNFSWLT
jgi:hypothetical protein